MAYLTLTTEDNNGCFKFIGANSNSNDNKGAISLLSDNSLLSSNYGGGMDSCSFYSGPSDETIFAFGESTGSVAYSGGSESCGSIAYSGGGESCGSVASSCSSGSSFSGGGCSYSC